MFRRMSRWYLVKHDHHVPDSLIQTTKKKKTMDQKDSHHAEHWLHCPECHCHGVDKDQKEEQEQDDERWDWLFDPQLCDEDDDDILYSDDVL